MTKIAGSVLLFVIAGLCEIGGGYLVWQSIRGGRGIVTGLLGGLILIVYGIIPTFQSSHFGRVYAAYGGIFVVMSLLWGWYFDKKMPDLPDTIGAIICLLGVAVIMYYPRG